MAPPSDLTTADAVLHYLSGTPFAASSAESLTGGTANFVYRIHLLAPYEGHSTFVLKFGRSFLEIKGTKVPFSLERQKFEMEALKAVRSWLPKTNLVTVPVVHFFDSDNHVLIMDDCGETSMTLKALIQKGGVRRDVADRIGRALGWFLALVHGVGEGQSTDFLALFAGNHLARSISSWATYGRLQETLDGSAGLAALRDPPLVIPQVQLQKATAIAGVMMGKLAQAKDKFVMGDFWPGNILITMEGEEVSAIQVLDWELAKTGLPELDAGQFLAELQLLCRFHPESQDAAAGTATGFLEAYQSKHELDRRTTLIHFGVHLITWTPRVSWGAKEPTRKAVVDGVEMFCTEEAISMADHFQCTW